MQPLRLQSQSAYLYYNFKTEKLCTLRHVHFVENVFPYSSAVTTTSLSPTSIPTCIQPSGPTPSNHMQIITTQISQNSNSTSNVSSLPTTSQNLSSPISMPTSSPTSSPPHVLPNSIESFHDILYTLGSSPSTHVDSSSCSPGPKKPSHLVVTRSKNGIFKPKQLHLASKFTLSSQIEPSRLSQALKHSE